MDTKTKKAIVRHAKSGMTYDQIQSEIGMCRATIANVLRAAGCTKAEIKYAPLKEKIIALYNKHGDYHVVAKKLGINYSKAYYHANRA